jgi:hypothetical protein
MTSHTHTNRFTRRRRAAFWREVGAWSAVAGFVVVGFPVAGFLAWCIGNSLA